EAYIGSRFAFVARGLAAGRAGGGAGSARRRNCRWRGRRHSRRGDRTWSWWRGRRRSDWRRGWRDHRRRGAAAKGRLLLVARRLLLPLSQRLVAAGSAGLLRIKRLQRRE